MLPTGRLEASRVKQALTTRIFGRELVMLQQTASTNDAARDLAARGAPEGIVVVAEEQTRGRGRMGRRWVAPPSTCLLCSILFRPELPVPQVPWLTMITSLAAAEAVDRGTGLRVWIKWPNDLVVRSTLPDREAGAWRKLAGVLTETGVSGEQVAFAVVGVGINVNVPAKALPGLAPDATSILAETGREVDRAALLAALLEGVEARYHHLRAGQNPHAEWAARLVTLGRPVEATTARGTIKGIAEAVDQDGALLLRTPDGRLHRLLAGDVTLSGA